MTIANLIPTLKVNHPSTTSGWQDQGSSTITENVAGAPDGNATAWTINDTDGGAVSSVIYGVTVAGDTTTYSAIAWVKKTIGVITHYPGVGVTFGDVFSPAKYAGIQVDTTAGTISTIGGWTAPDASGIVDWDANYWMVWVQSANNSQTTVAIRLMAALPSGALGGASTFWTPILAVGAVHPTLPIVNFSYTPSAGGAPLDVTFTDLSTGALTWSWNFGDGGTSSSQNPTYTYVDADARRTVSLTITADYIVPQTKTVQNAISVTPTPATKACIAWDNLLNDPDVTLVASSEQTGFEKENAADWRPYTWWKPNDGTATLELQFSEAREFNAFAVYGHNLGANAGWIKLQYSLDAGVTWLDAMPAVSPAGTEVIYRRCIPTMASRIRFQISSATASRFACLFVGTDLECERGLRIGFGPAAYNRATKLTNTVSQNGVWLGRSVIAPGAQVMIDLATLTEDFIREDWLPFVEHAELYPFFFLWDESQHSDEAAWCFADGAIGGSTFSDYGFMNTSIKAQARIE